MDIYTDFIIYVQSLILKSDHRHFNTIIKNIRWFDDDNEIYSSISLF